MGCDKKILFLGSSDSLLIHWLLEQGNDVIQTTEMLSAEVVANQDFIISYGYRYIINKDVLDVFPGRAINLHISYLPWNRGADPNLWSFIENTPKGATIHYLDEGLDTGDIIAQKEIRFDSETLATSYDKLHTLIQDLFKQNWHSIKTGKCPSIRQRGGSYHRSKDKARFSYLLTNGWDTPVSELRLRD